MLYRSFHVIRWMCFNFSPMLSLISSSMCWNNTPWCNYPATDSLVFSGECKCPNVYYISLIIFVPCSYLLCVVLIEAVHSF